MQIYFNLIAFLLHDSDTVDLFLQCTNTLLQVKFWLSKLSFSIGVKYTVVEVVKLCQIIMQNGPFQSNVYY